MQRATFGVSAGTVPLASSHDIQPAINVVTDWDYYPTSPACAWRAHDMWVSPTGVRVTLAHLLAGTQFTGTLVPRSFPDEVENPLPFTYRVTLAAVRASAWVSTRAA